MNLTSRIFKNWENQNGRLLIFKSSKIIKYIISDIPHFLKFLNNS